MVSQTMAPPSGKTATDASHLMRRGLVGIGIALVIDLAILVIARIVDGEFPHAVTAGGGTAQAIGPVPVIVVTIVVGALAVALRIALGRFSTRGATIWTWIAIAVTLVSLLGSLGGGDGAGARLFLSLIHIATGGAMIIALGRRPR